MNRVMKSALLVFVATLSFSFSSATFAAAAWAKGTINYIYLTGDGFIISLNGTSLNNCQYNRIWIRDSQHTAALVDRIYAAALAAQASGRNFEIVFDIAINGVGGACDALNGSTIIRDQP